KVQTVETGVPVPTPRDHLAVAAIDGRIYAIGGRVDGSDLPLMILGEHEAAQFWSKVTMNTGRQRRRHRVAVRGQPALAAKTHDVRADHQVLHNEARIAFEARAARRLHLDGLLFVDRKLRRF